MVVTVATVAILERLRSISQRPRALADHAVILATALLVGLCWPVVVAFTICHRHELK